MCFYTKIMQNSSICDFCRISEITNSVSKSPFRDRPEVKIQQKGYRWKAETLSFLMVEESAPEDITIKSHDSFDIGQKINKFHQNSQNS